MKHNLKKHLVIILIMFGLFNSTSQAKYEKLAYDFTFQGIDGKPLKFSDFEGKVVVVVNVASQCGFTSQYQDMQKIWEEYKDKDVVIVGIPSNDFGNQEPGSNKEIKNFCESKFGITFPMTEKEHVKGVKAHPFYIWAEKNFGRSAVPKWNFHKIIIDKEGKISETFTSITNPKSKKFIKSLEKNING